MCFTKTFDSREKAQNYLDKPKVAKKDITVYKWLKHVGKTGLKFKSLYRDFRWTRGYQYSDIPARRKEAPYISNYTWSWSPECRLNIIEGLYCFRSKKLAKVWFGTPGRKDILVEMIIPKGTTYYGPDDDGEIVSSSLIFPLL